MIEVSESPSGSGRNTIASTSVSLYWTLPLAMALKTGPGTRPQTISAPPQIDLVTTPAFPA